MARSTLLRALEPAAMAGRRGRSRTRSGRGGKGKGRSRTRSGRGGRGSRSNSRG